MVDRELAFSSATDMAAAIAAGELSPVELIDNTLQRIDEVNGDGTTAGSTWSFTTASSSAFHIASVNVAVEKVKGPRNKGVATITVEDADFLPVSGVDISGTFSGDWNGTRSGTTEGEIHRI